MRQYQSGSARSTPWDSPIVALISDPASAELANPPSSPKNSAVESGSRFSLLVMCCSFVCADKADAAATRNTTTIINLRITDISSIDGIPSCWEGTRLCGADSTPEHKAITE